MIVTAFGQQYDCEKATKIGDEADLYLADGGVVQFKGVADFSLFVFEDGDWETPPLPEIQSSRQEENKAALAAWLAAHPLTWTDGKRYGVEEQDQSELALNLMQYQVNKAAGQPAVLEWHAQKEECRAFEEAEYTALSMAISAYVYPYRRYQEKIKAAIYAAETAEAVEAVVIDYAGVIVEEGDADA